jgi:hypothetical protein
MLQSPIMNRIGGSPAVREELTQALAQGRRITAKVRWITNPTIGERGRNRWIAFTPLVGSHKQIGVWIAILMDDELEDQQRRPRQAPPVKFRVSLPPRQPSATPQTPPSEKAALSTPEESSFPPDIRRRPANTFVEQSGVLPDRSSSMPKEALPPSTPRSTSSVAPSIAALVPEIDDTYQTLEERLRKKRERDAARLRDHPTAVKPTYKSLSPYAFMNNDGP